MKKIIRLNPSLRKEKMLDAAIHLAMVIGYKLVSRRQIAEVLGVTHGLVYHYFKSSDEFSRAIMKEAISREIIPIIAQGLAAKDTVAAKAPRELKQKALSYLIK